MNYIDLKDIVITENIPDEIKQHPGMIAMQERKLLYSLARDYWRGGQIVDAGAFLGASTVAFGLGIKESLRPVEGMNRPILSFERALVTHNSGSQWFKNHALKAGVTQLQDGDSFEPLLRENIAIVSDLVDLTIGDICDYNGDNIHGIDICFLDCLKTEPIARHCMSIFFSKLNPGSFVIQQDYFFEMQSYIKVLMEHVADKFEYIGEACTSAVFRLRDKLSTSDIQDLSDMAFSPAQQLHLHRDAEDRTKDPSRQYLMCLSRASLQLTLEMYDEAYATWQAANEKYANLVLNQVGEGQPRLARQNSEFRNKFSRVTGSNVL